MKFAFRKLYLQLLQVKALSDKKDSPRYQEQCEVLRLLIVSGALFSTKKKNSKENPLFKYTNVLNSYARRDDYYRLAKESLKRDIEQNNM